MIRIFSRGAALLLPLGMMGCGRPHGGAAEAEPVLPRDMLGCYAIRDGNGRTASDSLYFVPQRVRLDSAAASPQVRAFAGAPAWLLARLDTAGRGLADEARTTRFLYWAADSLSDSIHVRFSTGFSGTELIVLPRAAPGDTLRGRAVEHRDMGPPFTTDAGPVTMIRVPCRAERA